MQPTPEPLRSPSVPAPPPSAAPPRITHRPVRFDFSAVPRHWFGGNAWQTHIANAVNMLFPAGERFFIRSVRHYEAQIADPALRAAIRAFYQQEGSHSHAHEVQLRALEAQGYDVRRILDRYERLAYDQIAPRFSPAMHLAVTVALEHYTAILAEGALRDHMLELADPVMRQLLRWHACEEIEHKAVAFDVLKQVDPRWSLRMAGMVVATLGLFGFWVMSFAMLAKEERRITGQKLVRPQMTFERSILRDVVWKGLRDYARRDFHPDDHDSLSLARAWLERAELPM